MTPSIPTSDMATISGAPSSDRYSPPLLDSGPEIRSPSPKKQSGNTSSLLGFGLPTSSPPVLVKYPHLGHYIFNLLSTANTSPPRAPAHPLSVSSSGESDGSGSDEDATPLGQSQDSGLGSELKTPKKPRKSDGSVSAADKEGLVRKIVELLDSDEEEQVKDILRPYMGELAKVNNDSTCRVKLTDRTKF